MSFHKRQCYLPYYNHRGVSMTLPQNRAIRQSPATCSLARMPVEIREHIYMFVLSTDNTKSGSAIHPTHENELYNHDKDGRKTRRLRMGLSFTCQQFFCEINDYIRDHVLIKFNLTGRWGSRHLDLARTARCIKIVYNPQVSDTKRPLWKQCVKEVLKSRTDMKGYFFELELTRPIDLQLTPYYFPIAHIFMAERIFNSVHFMPTMKVKKGNAGVKWRVHGRLREAVCWLGWDLGWDQALEENHEDIRELARIIRKEYEEKVEEGLFLSQW